MINVVTKVLSIHQTLIFFFNSDFLTMIFFFFFLVWEARYRALKFFELLLNKTQILAKDNF